jgi:L-threonylcarbamoyladenylate synthase
VITTRIIPVSSPADPAIHEAAALIRAGELVAFPTETVYGLGANATDANAVAKIFAAKGRPANDPIIVHVADRAQLPAVASDIPATADLLIRIFMPGPLTLVLSRSAAISPTVSAGKPTVGVRIPAHPIAHALMVAAGMPIAAPSANRFAHTSPTTAQHVYNDLNGKIPLILDGGSTPVGVESSIVDLTGDVPRLLRPGGISLEQLRGVLPAIEVVERFASADDAALDAPGMLLKHYSPRAALTLYEGQPDAVRGAILAQGRVLREQGTRVGLLIADEDVDVLAVLNVPYVSLGGQDDLDSVARRLFSGVRALDDAAVDVILARGFPPTGLGLAIRDRLRRAADGRIVGV